MWPFACCFDAGELDHKIPDAQLARLDALEVHLSTQLSLCRSSLYHFSVSRYRHPNSPRGETKPPRIPSLTLCLPLMFTVGEALFVSANVVMIGCLVGLLLGALD